MSMYGMSISLLDISAVYVHVSSKETVLVGLFLFGRQIRWCTVRRGNWRCFWKSMVRLFLQECYKHLQRVNAEIENTKAQIQFLAVQVHHKTSI